MASRAFAVFRDEPEAPLTDNIIGATTTVFVPPPSGPLLVYAPDKENVDPSNGSRVLPEQAACKKRKTALTTKAQPVSPSKKPRPLTEKPVKKASKPRLADKKPKRTTTSKRTTSSRARQQSREPSLPRLAEEGEEAQSIEQNVIDSKCRDLTVLPLADISEAYEQAVPKEDVVEDAVKAAEKAVASTGEKQVVPQPLPVEPSSPVKKAVTVDVFSTPEKKKVYKAFTFSSPCAAGERYASARGSSVERFSDIPA